MLYVPTISVFRTLFHPVFAANYIFYQKVLSEKSPPDTRFRHLVVSSILSIYRLPQNAAQYVRLSGRFSETNVCILCTCPIFLKNDYLNALLIDFYLVYL